MAKSQLKKNNDNLEMLLKEVQEGKGHLLEDNERMLNFSNDPKP
jgi:hypothetical protein